MKTFLQVQDPSNANKMTSSWIKVAVKTGIRILIGIDVFKKSKIDANDWEQAIGMATNLTNAQLRAQLRLNGQDPDAYFDSVSQILGDDPSGLNEKDINIGLAQADAASSDPTQLVWLWAAFGILMLMGLKGGISGARKRRGGYRPKARYKRPRPRYRKRRRYA